MKRLSIAALAVTMGFVASCATAPSTARATPSPSAAIATTAGSDHTTCAPGAHDETVDPYFPLKMVSATAGWAVGACGLGSRPSLPPQCYWPAQQFAGIVRTTDGARTWTDVSPPSIANRSYERADFFLDATHAWVAEVAAGTNACVRAVTTFSTVDGGATWRRGGTVAVKPESATSNLWDVPGPSDGMDFIDPMHGWMLVTSSTANPQPGAQVDPTQLYATSDGGADWKLVAQDPGQSSLGAGSGCPKAFYAPESDVRFFSPSSGWLEIACPPSVAMLRTDDGGVTWKMTAQPCSCTVWQPQYLDANDAMLTNLQGAGPVVTTTDGGSTWSEHQAPHAAQTYFSFVDPNDGWMVGIEQLAKSYQTVVYRTVDGGRSWRPVGKPAFATSTPTAADYYAIAGLQFVDSNDGFVVLGSEGGGGPGPFTPDPGVPDVQILATSDGGQTWMVVFRHIPAAACPNQYTQLGYGNGSLWPAVMASPTTGWARGGLRTTDGGLHWSDVSPAALREGSSSTLVPAGYGEFYRDADHAWLLGVYGSKAACMDHASVFGTADGGKTWQKSAPIALRLKSGERVAGQIGFTTASAGWMLITAGMPVTPDAMGAGDWKSVHSELFATSDAGLTWTHVASLGDGQLKGIPAPAGSQGCTPTFGQMTFISATVGWAQLNCADAGLMVTRDGGVTWRQTAAAVSAGGSFDLPQVIDSTHAITLSRSNDAGATYTVLGTDDAGATWHALTRPGTGYLLIMSPVNAHTMFALVTPPGWQKGSQEPMELYRTDDGAKSWNKVTSDMPATWPPGFMQFADPNHGFESNVNGADVILTTSDGGKDWKSIRPILAGSV